MQKSYPYCFPYTLEMVNVNGWDSGLLVAFGVASISVYCKFFTA
jgi:hypothetical protein